MAPERENVVRLYITRHGQTVWNLEHRYQGHRDSPLTADGEDQARLLAQRLADVDLTAVYSSDLRRAWRTAEMAVAGRGLDVTRDAAWRERAYGEWEGLTRHTIAERYPDLWRRRELDRAGLKPPGGESLLDVQRRLVAALEALGHRHAGAPVLVVTHGGSLWVLACTLGGDDLATSERPYLANCSLSIVEWGKSGPTVECWNDTDHLATATATRG